MRVNNQTPKTMFKLILTLSLLIPTLCYSQVGIGTTNPHPTAVLDVYSKSKGILIPRAFKHELTQYQHTNGTLVYVIDVYDLGQWVGNFWIPEFHGRVCVYDGQHWIKLEGNIL